MQHTKMRISRTVQMTQSFGAWMGDKTAKPSQLEISVDAAPSISNFQCARESLFCILTLMVSSHNSIARFYYLFRVSPRTDARRANPLRTKLAFLMTLTVAQHPDYVIPGACNMGSQRSLNLIQVSTSKCLVDCDVFLM